jgi:hypothetical protein
MDWESLPYGHLPVRLSIGGLEVARLCSRSDGSWYAALNQHLHHQDPERRDVACSSFEDGKAGVERWAERHMERLVRETSGRWAEAKDRVG